MVVGQLLGLLTKCNYVTVVLLVICVVHEVVECVNLIINREFTKFACEQRVTWRSFINIIRVTFDDVQCKNAYLRVIL